MTMTIDGAPRTLLPLNSRRLFVSLRIWLERPERWLGSMILLNEVVLKEFCRNKLDFHFSKESTKAGGERRRRPKKLGGSSTLDSLLKKYQF